MSNLAKAAAKVSHARRSNLFKAIWQGTIIDAAARRTLSFPTDVSL